MISWEFSNVFQISFITEEYWTTAFVKVEFIKNLMFICASNRIVKIKLIKMDNYNLLSQPYGFKTSVKYFLLKYMYSFSEFNTFLHM